MIAKSEKMKMKKKISPPSLPLNFLYFLSPALFFGNFTPAPLERREMWYPFITRKTQMLDFQLPGCVNSFKVFLNSIFI